MPTLPAHDYAKNGQLKELEEYLDEKPSCYINLKDDTYVSYYIIIIIIVIVNITIH